MLLGYFSNCDISFKNFKLKMDFLSILLQKCYKNVQQMISSI